MTGASLPIPFAIGETVWHARPDRIAERRVCPSCCGKRVLRVELGDGEMVTVDCEGCSRGFGVSDGVWTAYRHGHTPTPFVCRLVEARTDEIVYSQSPPGSGCYSLTDARDLFRDHAECAAACEAKTIESMKNIDESNARQRFKKRRRAPDMTEFYVGERARLREELARIEKCLAARGVEIPA